MTKKRAVDDLNRYVDKHVEKNPGGFLGDISKDIRGWTGDGAPPSRGPSEYNLFDDATSEEGMDNLIDKLRVDEDY